MQPGWILLSAAAVIGKKAISDLRTETAATLTREDFETRAGEIDPELLRNQDKLLGIWNS